MERASSLTRNVTVGPASPFAKPDLLVVSPVEPRARAGPPSLQVFRL
jgi:hypothetical protein